jgi:hypothetical protein
VLLDELDWWERKFPFEGGYFDQPHTLMQDLRAVRLAISHHRNAEAKKDQFEDQVAAAAAEARKRAGFG